MTILLTGSTGLVGARLLPRLVDAGFECRVLVRRGGEVPAGVTAVEGDLLDPSSLPQAVEGVSAIVHLAAVFRTTDTDLVWKSNVEGTRYLMSAAKTHAPSARFILSSTSNVYQADGRHPGHEDDEVAPVQAYPASKLVAEAELRASGLTWSVLRFAFVYGDGDGHLEALPHHARAAQWHPAMKMSTIHHRDIATAMKLTLAGAMDGQVVNLTDDAPTSIHELCRVVGAPIGDSADPLLHPWQFHVDGSRARRLGFQPTVRSVHQAVAEGLL